ncbi:MAG: inositol 2-dehydrogenase [Propionibacteriaceae bacterium]|jgi:myo-inositol 2-dehydrogenase/D-chiro-inositol 1-dehydrogenase|nr:inositol 2-dehydrogenase [Propionibacteriaceae bacterium]
MLALAVLGAGRIGAIHAANAARHPRVHLAWVVDPVQDAARRLAAATGAEAGCDPLAAIADPAVDAVVISSPTATHIDLIRAAVAAGKAVLCEKPVGLDFAAARACLRDVGAGGRVMIGFNRRFDPAFAETHRRVAAGEIGRLEQLIIVSRDPTPPSPAYVAGSGGLFRDMTIHDFDLARFFLGEITSVQAFGQNIIDPAIAAAGDNDAGVAILTAADGAAASIVNSRRCVAGYDQRLEAFGAAGLLSVDNITATTVRSSTAAATGAASPWLDFFLERYAAAYERELAAFVAAVEAGAEFCPSLADGVKALAIADAAVLSAQTKRAVVPAAV